METAMQKAQRELRAQAQPAVVATDNTYIPGAQLPESGIKAVASEGVSEENVKKAEGTNINDPKAQVSATAAKHADGIEGATVDGRGNPIVTSDVLKAKARAHAKGIQQLKPTEVFEYNLFSIRPGFGTFVSASKRIKFTGNYFGTNDVKVKDYLLAHHGKFVSEITKEEVGKK